MGSSADLTCVACDGDQAWVGSLRPSCIARVQRLGSQPHLVDAISWKTWVNDMSIDPSGRFHVVGTQGRYWSGRGDDWIRLKLPCGDLIDAWSLAAGEVVLCGDAGVRVHLSHNDRALEIFDNDGLADEMLYDVVGRDADRFFAVGEQGTLLTYDSKRWQAEDTGEHSLLSVTRDDAGQLFISGRHGLLMRRDDLGWHRIATPKAWTEGGGEDIYGITVYRGECYVAAGHGGLGKVVADRVELLRDTPLIRLAVSSDGLLYAVGECYIEWFDGSRWHGGHVHAPDPADIAVVKPRALRPKRRPR